MNASARKPLDSNAPTIVREYTIRGTKYVVKAATSNTANEDAAAKVRRLIRNEMSHKAE